MNQLVSCIVLSAFITVACNGPSRTKPVPLPKTAQADPEQMGCEDLFKRGIELRYQGRYQEAITVYERGRQECGGVGFVTEIVFCLTALKKYDQAADHLMQILVQPGPSFEAFESMFRIFPRLSSSKQAEVTALGTSCKQPIYVPHIAMEYRWVTWVCCRGKRPMALTQSLIINTGDGDKADVLDYECEDGTKGDACFDFSADDYAERWMKIIYDRVQQEKKKQKELKDSTQN